MRVFIFGLLIISSYSYTFGQKGVFDNYDFDSGAYHLQGIYLQQHQATNIADTISNFYLADIEALNWCKTNWKFTDTIDRYIDSYTYRLTIFKDKQPVESFWINLLSDVMRTSEGQFTFNNQLLLKWRSRLIPLQFAEYNFSSVEAGRDSLQSIILNENILSYYCEWSTYDGVFTMKVPYTEEALSTEDVELDLQQELSAQFPDETFALTYASSLEFGENPARIFEVKCSKNMYAAYKDDKSEWSPYNPILYARTIN